MSAIFGVINKKDISVSEEVMVEMRDAIKHRAPDGSRFCLKKNTGIGFCKMVIYSSQIEEIQPHEESDFIVAANARIDNKVQFCKLLKLPVNDWKTISDALLILKAYQLLGEKFLNHLEGEFAIVIWNKKQEELFIATDPIGFRPLYYYDGPEQFIFCSEIKGITAIKTSPNHFNSNHLSEFFYRQTDPSETYNKEIFLLCGGSVLTYAESATKIKKYWTPQSTEKYHLNSDADWTECLKDLLYKAVAKRLKDTIHPVGITLSGGLDSTSITCILSELLAKENKELHTFSSVLPANYSGNKTDERYYIELLNKQCPNLIQTFVETPELSPFDNVGKAFNEHETFPNAFFYMDEAITTAVSAKGVKLLFSGYGGDYWVSRKGNTVIFQLLLQGRIRESLKLISKLRSVEQIAWLRVFKREIINHLIISSNSKKDLTFDWLTDEINQSNHIKPPIIDENANILNMITSGRIGKLTSRLSNTYASKAIQSADPMFDKDVFDLLTHMPIRLFVQSGYKRNVIRKAMDGVIPSEIQWRRTKSAYNPDYRAQVINNLPSLVKLLSTEGSNSSIKKYLVTNKILNSAANSQEIKLNDSQVIKLSQIGIAYASIQHLEDLGYQI